MRVYYGDSQVLHAHLTQEVRAALQNGQTALVLVPEMATLKTERELLTALGLSGSFDMQILSPSRMSERVFEQEGMGSASRRIRIGDTGKVMAVSAAAMQCEKDLRYYHSAIRRQGFLRQMTQLIADLKRAQVMPQALFEHVQTLPEGATRDKLHDTALIYRAYTDLIAQAFADGEDVTDALIGLLEQSTWLQSGHILALGFDVVTGQFARTLCALEKGGRQVTLLMKCMPAALPYAPVMESVGRLHALCREQGMELQTITLPPEAEKLGDLHFLKRHFLNGDIYRGAPDRVRLFAAPTPYDEMRRVAQEILRLHEGGMPFARMAVTFGDSTGYDGVTESVFKSYGIPCYLPRKLTMDAHGAARFLLSSLRCAASMYDPQDVLDMLHSGYAPIGDEDAFALENYILAYGIRGKHFLAPFVRGDSETCAQLETVRMALTEPLEALRLGLENAQDVRDALTHVFTYLENCGIYDHLMADEEKLLARGLTAQAAQGRQVWSFLITLMDEMCELSGNLPMTPRQMLDMLEAGIEQKEIAALPPDGGSVMCGQIGNMAGEMVDALFLCNLSDGVMNVSPDPMLTEDERLSLEKETASHIALTLDGRDDLKLLDFYHTLCTAQQHLFLSRAMASQAGESRPPHLYLNKLRRMMPLLPEEGGVTDKGETPLPLSPQTAADELALRFFTGHMDAAWQNAWRYLCTQHLELAKSVQQAFLHMDEAVPLSREVTKELFLERVMSVSRLESYAACPYQHFVRYGLQAQPRKEWKIQSQDAGNFYHSAMEGFTRLLPSIPNWPRIQKKDCDAWMDQVSQDLMESQFGTLMADSARVKASGEKYKKVLRRVAWAFTKGAQHSHFQPGGSEVRFGYGEQGSLPAIELVLNNGRRVLLRGVIDRIDRYEGDEGVFLRVVDYKSGHRELNPTQVFYGRQLQLLIYLMAAVDSGRGAQPAGAYYFSLQDPLIEDPFDLQLAEQKLAEKLHLKGVTLKNAQVVHLMDDAVPPLTMPKLLKQDGEFMANKQVAELEDMRALLLHARETARDLCENMRRGMIAAKPLTEKTASPCDYCDYAAICRRENSRPRRVDALSFDELLDKINEKSTHSTDG